MKLIYIYAAACLLGWGCTTKTHEEKGKQVFLMDSLYENDKETMVIHKGDKVLLSEEKKNFEENPNISRADLDAINHVESKEMQYIKKGDRIVLSEKKQ